MSGEDLAAAQAAMTGDRVAAATASLVNSSSGWGTDEEGINSTLLFSAAALVFVLAHDEDAMPAPAIALLGLDVDRLAHVAAEIGLGGVHRATSRRQAA